MDHMPACEAGHSRRLGASGRRRATSILAWPSRTAVAAPTPVDAPVTIATLPGLTIEPGMPAPVQRSTAPSAIDPWFGLVWRTPVQLVIYCKQNVRKQASDVSLPELKTGCC
jgi:hypothetical protein